VILRLLLDTHILLWAAAGEGLPKEAENLIEDKGNELFFSAASIWEVAIKSTLGRQDFNADPQMLKRGI
jgi:PIN domain nuclease of toxin-antitoxin system